MKLMTDRYQQIEPGAVGLWFTDADGPILFRCDTAGHRIVVSDADGHVKYAFGGFGRQGGAFDTPLDIAFVCPEFLGEPMLAGGADALWLAVADYGNRRVQIFELDGVLVGSIDEDMFDAGIGAPCALSWRAPALEIEGVDGVKTRVHLGAALLGNGPAPATMPTAFHVRRPRGFWENC
jgi:hypothetical protein